MPTERTQLVRRAQRGHYDPAAVHAVVDATLICHLATVVNGEPRVLPTAVWRMGKEAIVHGAAANGLLTTIAGGAPFALCVTCVDGLVLARSAFHHSVNFRSLVAFGQGRPVDDLEEKRRASAAFLDKVCAGRSKQARMPTDAELKATRFVALPLDEASVKVRDGGVRDDEADLSWPCWAGVVPVEATFGAPVADHGVTAAAPSGPFCI